jgi:hypothetical protein
MKANLIKSADVYVEILDSCISQGLHISKEQKEKAIRIAKQRL